MSRNNTTSDQNTRFGGFMTRVEHRIQFPSIVVTQRVGAPVPSALSPSAKELTSVNSPLTLPVAAAAELHGEG